MQNPFYMGLDINVRWQCVNTTTLQSYKSTPSLFCMPFKPSLTRPAVLTLTAVWRHISEGRATGVDWQPCIAIVSALSGYDVLHFLRALAAIMSTMCLHVRLNIRVFIFS